MKSSKARCEKSVMACVLGERKVNVVEERTAGLLALVPTHESSGTIEGSRPLFPLPTPSALLSVI